MSKIKTLLRLLVDDAAALDALVDAVVAHLRAPESDTDTSSKSWLDTEPTGKDEGETDPSCHSGESSTDSVCESEKSTTQESVFQRIKDILVSGARKGAKLARTAVQFIKSNAQAIAVGGALVVILAAARRAGVDRYVEAGVVERLHTEEFARQFGGEVVEFGGSPYAPDGGVDTEVRVGQVLFKIQSKHYGHKITKSEVQRCADHVDIIAVSNEITDNVDLATHGLRKFTTQDWSRLARAKLECRRILRGFEQWGRVVRASLKVGMRLLRSRLSSVASLVSRITLPQLTVLVAGGVLIAGVGVYVARQTSHRGESI